MPRQPRIEYPGALYHVLSRGNRGGEIFRDDADRQSFMRCLTNACGKTGWIIHAFVMMPNHYHMLLETPEANLVAGMRWLQGVYTQRFNLRHGIRGPLLRGRYKALNIDPSEAKYLLTVSTYIHLNPVRTGLTGHPEKGLKGYRWSSFPYYLEPRSQRPEWLETERVLGCLALGADNAASRRTYSKYIAGCADELRTKNGQRNIDNQWRQIRRGWYLGSEDFRNRLSKLLIPVLELGEPVSHHGAAVIDHGLDGAEELLQRGMEILSLSEHDLHGMRKTDDRKRALAWLLRKNTTVTNKWVSERLLMGHPVNVSMAVKIIDDADTDTRRAAREKLVKWVSP